MPSAPSPRRLRLLVRTLSLGLFVWLLLGASWPLARVWLPPDLFLRFDPLAATLLPLAARQWLPSLWPGLAFLLLALVAGRLFCGYICPMGITLDVARHAGQKLLGAPGRPRPLPERLRTLKYLVLAALAVAALIGVNLVHWGSPLSLITRFYALLVHPLLLLAGDTLQTAALPLWHELDIASLSYLSVGGRRYDSVYFLLGLFGLLFGLERLRPRFWCRYLCPAGALLGLFSLRPLWRRRVGDCSACGVCAARCPGGAVEKGGPATSHTDCLACRACVENCSLDGSAFAFTDPGVGLSPRRGPRRGADHAVEEHATGDHAAGGRAVEEQAAGGNAAGGNAAVKHAAVKHALGDHAAVRHLPSRRAFLGAATGGALLAAAHYTGGSSLLGGVGLGSLWSEGLIRPPGALPEADFQRLCLRCGECMKACPTNALQPAWWAAGPEGIFSPLLLPRRGPCEPDCRACGAVCPTGAVKALPLEEKHRAKVGTATVRKERCLAWAEKRRCVVCQEVCPYGSVKLQAQGEGAPPAPVVDATRCFGCGYCEHHCPTRLPAIVVEPLGALRLKEGSYAEAAQSLGLTLEPGAPLPYVEELPEGELPPGFTE